MNRFLAPVFLLIFPSLFAATGWAQTPTPIAEKAAARSGAKTPPVAPVPQQLFGTIPLATKSEEARKFAELALDKYENGLLADAVVHARHASEKDPQFALGHALLSFASRRGIPDSAALAKAKSLLPRATPDEQLLVRWMTSVQDRDLLPAIMNMNDLLRRYPTDKHVLYLTAEWLYSQQDYDRARARMEAVRRLDPNFPPALNMLGYAYIETGDPDPAKAVATLEHYAELQPGAPNPEDSLGEVLRMTGDDRGSLEHYSAGLQIDPTYFSSQLGLADTLTLMGNFSDARKEYDRAIQISDNHRDELHARYQEALEYFWEGQPSEGHKALDALAKEAGKRKEPNAQFEIGMGRAMLASDFRDESKQLETLSAFLEKPLEGMSESDRGTARAAVLLECVRVDALNGLLDHAAEDISKLERYAATSRDLIVESHYESARGYLLFSQSDFANAADELAADSRSPLALRQLAIAQDKLGNAAAAQSTRTRLKYQRTPTAEWFLTSHADTGKSR
jgi:tetratricopeptide (TPR) repeat protein